LWTEKRYRNRILDICYVVVSTLWDRNVSDFKVTRLIDIFKIKTKGSKGMNGQLCTKGLSWYLLAWWKERKDGEEKVKSFFESLGICSIPVTSLFITCPSATIVASRDGTPIDTCGYHARIRPYDKF